MKTVNGGWRLVAAAMVSWAALLVTSRILVVGQALDPWTFTFVQMIAGGVAMMLLGVGAPTDWRRLAGLRTCAIGLLRVVTAAAFTAALVHVDAMRANLLGASSLPIAALAYWLLGRRRPAPTLLTLHVLLIAAIAWIASELPGGWRNPAVLLMLISEVCVVVSSLLAETHPALSDPRPRAKLRFTGMVLLSTAAFLLAARLLEAAVMPERVDRLVLDVDALSQHLVLGATVGVTLRAVSMHLTLQAIHRVGTPAYLGAATTLPALGLGLESLAAAAGWIAAPVVGPADLAGLLLVMGLALLIVTRR